MPTLSKQLLIKISPELDELITQAFSQYLKNTGEYSSRSDYIRRAIGLILSLDKDDVCAIYAHLNNAARDAREQGNDEGAKGLQEKADKFKNLWGSMLEEEKK